MEIPTQLKEAVLKVFPSLYAEGIFKQFEKYGLIQNDTKAIKQSIYLYFMNKDESFWNDLEKYAEKKHANNKNILIRLGKRLSEELQIIERDIVQLREIFRSEKTLHEGLHGTKYRTVAGHDENLERDLIARDRFRRYEKDKSLGWIERYDD